MKWRLVSSAVATLLFGVILLSARPSSAQKDFSQPPQMNRAPPQGAPPSRNAHFALINNSDQNIDILNISPPDDDSWGEDLFGTLALPPNSRVIAAPSQLTGCLFDVRVIYHDRREEVVRRQDLCQLQELAFTGRNARLPRAGSQSHG